mmetsp:Transcript_22531/g.32926  ORF Transcript_22531/g.32926 Transcript_22531/m.32926 type:complete len:1011 (+) Transcript_22531:60-3092(+)|eukprot:CAMPEP_0185020782 /NCGR_PEP_ID=MMETSP1103-20130426/3424_1 /TAXON_ID=36769 /ORGANISM="Paraphysomonas bandaiensis, Strain Caron Lab Isolate" /LENGTH=1010 /DNA_ID=CAMNT_0027551897 /DNA_START=49 /DNA_END=3081 /DNA_ORIENTATION=+
MQTTRKAGYNNRISKFVVSSFSSVQEEQQEGHEVVLDIDEALARKYAIALQSAWRSRTARLLVGALKQESNCKKHRSTHPVIQEDGTLLVMHCDTCTQGEAAAEVRQKVSHQRYCEIDRLLFSGQKKLTVNDAGDNWNQRFQRIMDMPENTDLERSIKYAELYTLNHDFVHTATTYAQTIISEYFLHIKDKSIVAKNMGGIAGGEKYLWRGILFKMADGATGPYNGSDEAAAKAAGHDLKGSIHYYNAGVRELHLPLMALIDYKGFRMTAQAFLPLGNNSLVYGSADGGRVIHKSHPGVNSAMERAAAALNLRAHSVGPPGHLTELHAAVDIEGHIGMDNRIYLLDLSRTFPPEAPSCTRHLDDIYEDGSIVQVRMLDSETGGATYIKGTVHRACSHGDYYDILFADGTIIHRVPASDIKSRSLSIFWRLLRPEYVHGRGVDLVPLRAEDINPLSSDAVVASERERTSIHSPMHSSPLPAVDQISTTNAIPSSGVQPQNKSYTDTAIDCVDETVYDEFEELIEVFDKSQPEEELETVQKETVYDEFDSTPTITKSDDQELNAINGSQTYDHFGTTPDEMKEETIDSTPGYGYLGEDLPPQDLALGVSPSVLRMRRNSQFETKNFQEIVEYVNRYNHFDVEAVRENVDGYEEYADFIDTQKRKKEYIDAAVRDLYGEEQTAMGNTDSYVSTPPHSRCGNDTHILSPTPLSPDALTAFSNYDPEGVDRNREVIRATERLVREVIPALANVLAKMRQREVIALDIPVFFHARGVNIRHMGLVRSNIPASNSTASIRTALLLQMVVRTLKNIARDFQRRWMKSERSSSQQGIFMLLTQFLNLIVGRHSNSEAFWTERVAVGLIQRFGKCAIDGNEDHLHRIRRVPSFLKGVVQSFLSVMCLSLKPTVLNQFLEEKSPYGFEFMVEDVERLEPRVKYMHIVDFISGVIMQEQADYRATQGGDPRTIARLRSLAGDYFSHAEKALPTHKETCDRSGTIKVLNETEKRSISSRCNLF